MEPLFAFLGSASLPQIVRWVWILRTTPVDFAILQRISLAVLGHSLLAKPLLPQTCINPLMLLFAVTV